MPTITLLEPQKRHAERVNVYIDGQFAFSLNALEAAKLRHGQTVTEEDLTQLQERDMVAQAVDKGAVLLSYRPRSVQEVRQQLQRKGFSPSVIEQAIARLQALRYLDDEAFARFWVESRANHKQLSQRALRYELKKKGIADDVIDEVLRAADDTESALQAAAAYARKLRGHAPQHFKEKLEQFLQRRGFSYSESRHATQAVLAQLMEDNPDFFALDES